MTTDRAVDDKIRIGDRTLTVASKHAVNASPNELGGIVLGWWEGEHTVVGHELVPVPDEHAGRAHYERRWARAQQILDDYLRRCDDPRLGYMGEWHSHPVPQPPSSIDRAELRAVTRQFHRPVALVVISLTSEGDVIPHGLICRPRWPLRTAIRPAPIERAS